MLKTPLSFHAILREERDSTMDWNNPLLSHHQWYPNTLQCDMAGESQMKKRRPDQKVAPERVSQRKRCQTTALGTVSPHTAFV